MGISFYFLLFMGRKVKHQYVLNYKNLPYIEKTKNLIGSLKNEVGFKDNLYVFGNQVEIYYFLDKLPPTHFPINFPWIADYFFSEKQIISEIKNKKVKYVVIPLPESKEYLDWHSLKQFINENYSLVKNTDEFQLLILKEIKNTNF